MNQVTSEAKLDSLTTTTTIVLIGIVVLLNWPFEYVAAAVRYDYPGRFSQLNYDTFFSTRYECVAAGFPLNYLIRDELDLVDAPKYWSMTNLAINVLIGLIFVVGAGAVTTKLHYLSRRGVEGKAMVRRYQWLLGALMAVPALFCLIWCVSDRVSQRRLIAQFTDDAALVEFALVPRSIVRVFPAAVFGSFSRVRGLTFINPSKETVGKAIPFQTIRSLSFIGATPNESQMRQLIQNNELKSLNFAFLSLTAEVKSTVGELKGLRRLTIETCLGLNDGLGELTQCEKLESLEIVNSDLRLANLPTNGWPKFLTALHVSRPYQGSDRLKLSGLQNLKTLNVARTDNHFNEDLVTVILHELPRLENLTLETSQKFSLSIDVAPRLASIIHSEQDQYSIMNRSGVVPASPWIQSLVLSNLPSLQNLSIDGLDLNQFSISGMPNLQRLSITRLRHRMDDRVRQPKDDPRHRMQSLIDTLGAADGPSHIDLAGLPLGGVDLSPLLKNTKIYNLGLAGSDIDGKQLCAIASMPRLTHVDVRYCNISDRETHKILQRRLPLESFWVNADVFEDIEVVDQPELKHFITTTTALAKKVLIKNSPALEDELSLGNCVQCLKVSDARSLLGISVNGPLPLDSELRGFRALRFFAIGGPQANDILCDPVWNCEELDHLTIAYGQLSREALANVGSLRKLTMLCLPGSDLDDGLIQDHWQSLDSLSEVNLSDTSIGRGTIEFLVKRKNLQRLAVNYCRLTKDDLEIIAEIKQLIEVEVAGIGLSEKALVNCLRKGMLDRLDLADSEVTPAMVKILSSDLGNSLRFLGLQGCNLDDDSIKQIADAHPMLAMDIARNLISDATRERLDSKMLLLDRCDRDGFLRHASGNRHLPIEYLRRELDTVSGRIDVHQFKKPPVVAISRH